MITDFLRFGPELDGWGPSLEHPMERKRRLSWEPIIGAITTGISDGAQALGIGANTAAQIGQVAAPALIGAGGGALSALVTGANPGTSALIGGGIGGLYGGYQAAGGLSGIAQALGLSGNASAVPGTPNYSSMTPEQQVAADVQAEGQGGMTPAQRASVDGAIGGSGGSSSGAVPVDSKKGLSNTSLALGALATLGSAMAQKSRANQPYNSASLPGPSATAATQGPLFNAPMNPTGYINRTPLTPAGLPGAGYNPSGATPQSYANSYFTYGPEPSFFNNNSVNLGKGFARGGGALFQTGAGQHYVEGGSDGQADDNNAHLSDGEYVFDATTVSRLGNGNNAAGARKLDAARKAIASDSGSTRVVQKKIRKSPLSYLAEAR